MSVIGRNDLCPCGSGKKYKKCHLSASGFSELPNDSSTNCICGSGLNPINCCGSYLTSQRRISPSVRTSQFSIESGFQEEYAGKVYLARLSNSKREWDAFRNIYIYGIEINERFFRPKTLDVVMEFQSDEECHLNVRCNLDYETGAIIKFQIPNNLKTNKLHYAASSISISKALNQIEVPYIKILNHRYLRLLHHTSVSGYEGITNSQTIWTSPYDLQGSTRELKETRFSYFTDIPELKYESDLFAVAMRDKSQAAFRTDDESQLSYVEIYKQPVHKREKRLTFYLDINLIAPVPAIYHNQEGTQYIEFFHPHIFRVGVNLNTTLPIESFEDGWKICENSIEAKVLNVFPIANGNILTDLSKIYQDRYIEA
ncbi:SEC-C motif-containing protein [Salinibacillus kushneri]|uniref:SEC-C motif-containing protein n=1 Tax=Salinibacillus kushneri TaxID=237682 RepID=A0A1I0A5G7_9BACI|nr:SEC-C domain-containing protein [Salinibacillus kushneri]SES88896.1 SEC-C motif-containing protein [Salinibacillus kushneri]